MYGWLLCKIIFLGRYLKKNKGEIIYEKNNLQQNGGKIIMCSVKNGMQIVKYEDMK